MAFLFFSRPLFILSFHASSCEIFLKCRSDDLSEILPASTAPSLTLNLACSMFVLLAQNLVISWSSLSAHAAPVSKKMSAHHFSVQLAGISKPSSDYTASWRLSLNALDLIGESIFSFTPCCITTRRQLIRVCIVFPA